MEVCGYVTARDEDGTPKEVCGHPEQSHGMQPDDLAWECFDCLPRPMNDPKFPERMTIVHAGHRFVPATRCETCGGTGQVEGPVLYGKPPHQHAAGWGLVPCPDCVLGLVRVQSLT